MTNLKVLGLCDTRIASLNPEMFPKNLKELNLSGTGAYTKTGLEILKMVMTTIKIYP